MFIFYIIALYALPFGVTSVEFQCFEAANPVDWFFVYKLPGGKSSHRLLPNAATDWFFVYKLPGGKSSHYLKPGDADWAPLADIDAAQQPIHSTMNTYFNSGNKDNANIILYSNYPPHFKFELPMSPGKGVIMAEDANKGFWLVHTAKYFPNLAGAIGDLFSNEKTKKDAAAFLCMTYSDVNLRAIAKIIDYEQPIVFFTQRSAAQAAQAFYDSSEIQTLVNGLHKYQPTASTSGDGITTFTPPGPVKIFASAPVAYSSDIYSNYIVKILKKSMQVYTPGTTATVLRKSCVGPLKVENVLGPITVKDTEIPIGQDSARWSVPKSDSDFICLSNTGRTKSATVQAFYDSSEIQKLVNGLHKYQPTASASGDGIATLTPPGTVKIFASAPVGYSSDIYLNYIVKIMQKSFQVYTPGTTATVLKKSCVGTLKVENVLGPITVKDTVIQKGEDSARWSVPKSDSDFICLSNTGRTANDAKYGATVACVLSKEAADLFRNMIKKENLDACPFFVYKLPGGKSSHYLKPGDADWAALADIDVATQPIHSTMEKYFTSGNKDHANIIAYSNYPPHFKFELPMSPGKGLIMAETANKGFWLVHTAKYFPNLAGTTATLFSNEKTTKDAAAFLCMSYSDVNLRAIAKIIDYEQPIIYFTQRSASAPVQPFYDSPEIQKLVNGLQKYQPIAATSGDGVRTLTQPGTVKIFASAPVAYSSGVLN
ncbi:Plancitoxin-1 [Trichinella sp. T8]|nr:Plancitoxin-1 [Trichinella sp. T8]